MKCEKITDYATSFPLLSMCVCKAHTVKGVLVKEEGIRQIQFCDVLIFQYIESSCEWGKNYKSLTSR